MVLISYLFLAFFCSCTHFFSHQRHFAFMSAMHFSAVHRFLCVTTAEIRFNLFAAISGTPLMYVAICDVTSMLRSAVIRYFSGANRFFVVAQVCNGSASSSESGSCTAAASGTCWLTNSCCNLANAVCRNLRSS